MTRNRIEAWGRKGGEGGEEKSFAGRIPVSRTQGLPSETKRNRLGFLPTQALNRLASSCSAGWLSFPHFLSQDVFFFEKKREEPKNWDEKGK